MIYITEPLLLCNNVSTLPLAKALEEQDGLPLPDPLGRESARWRRSLRIFVHFVSKPRPSLAGWRGASEVHRGQWGGPGPVVGGDRRWGEVTEMRKEWAVSCQGTCCSEDLDRDVICQVSNSFIRTRLLRKATLHITLQQFFLHKTETSLRQLFCHWISCVAIWPMTMSVWIVLESLDKGALCFVIVRPTKYRDLLLILPTINLDDKI